METEILEATDLYGENKSFYEVEKHFLTWEDREKQVREENYYSVYCLFEAVRPYNHGSALVNSWASITKEAWQQCRKVVRKI